MVYILNTSLKNGKRVKNALCEIYGIGKVLSLQVCESLGFSDQLKVSHLTQAQIQQLSQMITQNLLIGGDRKRELLNTLQRLQKIGCYRGFRHNVGLPARGQRTHGNARTVRRIRRNNRDNR